jgi:hypothetical protein
VKKGNGTSPSQSPVKKHRKTVVTDGQHQEKEWEVVNLKQFKKDDTYNSNSNSSSLGQIIKNVKLPENQGEDEIGVGLSPPKKQRAQDKILVDEMKVNKFFSENPHATPSESSEELDQNKEKTRALLRNFELHKEKLVKGGLRAKSLQSSRRPNDLNNINQKRINGKTAVIPSDLTG